MHKAAQGLLLRAVRARQRSPISRNLGSFDAFDLGDDIRLDSLAGEPERDQRLSQGSGIYGRCADASAAQIGLAHSDEQLRQRIVLR